MNQIYARTGRVAPFGSWESPISAADTVAGVVRYSDIQYDGGVLYWLEGRPSEGGRSVLVRRLPDGTVDEPLGPDANVRTMVHEYGGGAYLASVREIVYSEYADQQLYRLHTDRALTPEPDTPRGLRYADAVELADGSLVCVRETHGGSTEPDKAEAVNELVRIDRDGGVSVVASGSDFYSSPKVSPDGTMLAWIEWDHPNMPWDGTRLVVASVDDPEDATVVAGGDDESVMQPEWALDGSLVFVSDRTGWWNLYRRRDGVIDLILEMDAEFSDPQWVFGESSFALVSHDRIVASYWQEGVQHLCVIDREGVLSEVDGLYSRYRFVTTDSEDRIWFVGTRADGPTSLVQLELETETETVIASNPRAVSDDHVSRPKLITFPTTGDDVAHGVYYPPQNPAFVGPEGDRPPLLVHIHGGPTAQVQPEYSAGTLFWTSRGFGVLDVNYRGSTGFGRDFAQKLVGQWGVVDVDDAVAGARYLAQNGDVDGGRLVISGGSAGGYTTLAALAFKDVFAAGVSYYGVADIEILASDTHKFESRYVDGLVGTDPDVWRSRSPLYSADQISVPVALFQGLDDAVVPPNQAVMIAEALERNGIPHLHVEYAGEGHGFRNAANIITTLETELAFYGAVLGFVPSGDLPHVDLSTPEP